MVILASLMIWALAFLGAWAIAGIVGVAVVIVFLVTLSTIMFFEIKERQEELEKHPLSYLAAIEKEFRDAAEKDERKK